MTQQSAQRFAKHAGTGMVWDANDVDDEHRDGPWECVVDGCPVVYSGHRRPYTRFRYDTGEEVSGSFIIRGESRHDESLPHERIPGRSTEQRVDTSSRRHIHRLTGLAAPPIRTEPATAERAGGTHTRYEYGYSIDTAAGLLAFQDTIDADPALALSDQIRFGRTLYWWRQLAYPPTRDAFARLFSTITSQVTTDRVYFVNGVVKYHAYVDDLHSELLLLRVMADLSDEGQELWVFMPNEPQFARIVSSLSPGERVAVLANQLVTGRHRPALSILEPHQLEILPTV